MKEQTIYQPLPNDATLWRALELDGPLKSLKQGDLGADQMVLVSQDSEKGTQIVVNSLAMMMHPFHLQSVFPCFPSYSLTQTDNVLGGLVDRISK